MSNSTWKAHSLKELVDKGELGPFDTFEIVGTHCTRISVRVRGGILPTELWEGVANVAWDGIESCRRHLGAAGPEVPKDPQVSGSSAPVVTVIGRAVQPSTAFLALIRRPGGVRHSAAIGRKTDAVTDCADQQRDDA